MPFGFVGLKLDGFIKNRGQANAEVLITLCPNCHSGLDDIIDA